MEITRDTQVFRKSKLYPDRDRYSRKKYQNTAGQRLRKEGKREREREREREKQRERDRERDRERGRDRERQKERHERETETGREERVSRK